MCNLKTTGKDTPLCPLIPTGPLDDSTLLEFPGPAPWLPQFHLQGHIPHQTLSTRQTLLTLPPASGPSHGPTVSCPPAGGSHSAQASFHTSTKACSYQLSTPWQGLGRDSIPHYSVTNMLHRWLTKALKMSQLSLAKRTQPSARPLPSHLPGVSKWMSERASEQTRMNE